MVLLRPLTFPGKQISSRLPRSRGKSQCPFNAGIGLSLPLHLAACWWDLSYETLHKEPSVHSSTCLQKWPRDLARTKDLPFQVDSICGSRSHLQSHPSCSCDAWALQFHAPPSYFPCGKVERENHSKSSGSKPLLPGWVIDGGPKSFPAVWRWRVVYWEDRDILKPAVIRVFHQAHPSNLWSVRHLCNFFTYSSPLF